MIQFAQPFGFWLGLAAIGVLAAHLVRRRAKRVAVPFLPLWTALLEGKRGGFGSAATRFLDLLLVLLVCAAVAAAAGGPFVAGTPSTVRDLVLVLDGGVELRAAQRLNRLRTVASVEIRRRAVGTRMVLVRVTDDGAEFWSGTDRDTALQRVREHKAGWLAAREGEALRLAREAAKGLTEPDLVFCTARPLKPAGFRMRHFGGEVQNAGIVSLEVLADPEGGGRLARLGLAGKGEVSIGEHWSGTLDGETSVDIPLPAGGRVTLSCKLDGDAFWCDDQARLILPTRKLPRVLVVAKEDPSPFLSAALQALEKTGVIAGPLGKTTPQHAVAAARTHDLLIFDRCAPDARIRAARTLFLAPPQAPALPFKVGQEQAAPTMFDVRREHPLLKGLDLGRIPPRRARAIYGGEALAFAAPGPVLATGPGWVALGFDPDRCVLAASPAYPLFLRNAILELAQVLTRSEAEFFAVGERAPVPGIAEIEGRGKVRVENRFLGAPGFWKLEKKAYALSLLQPRIDLRGPATTSDRLADVGDPGRADQPLTTPFSAVALVLLLIGWWIFWRGA